MNPDYLQNEAFLRRFRINHFTWSVFSIVLIFLLSCKPSPNDNIPPQNTGPISPPKEIPLPDGSPEGDIVGKLITGYQGWFGASGDKSAFNSWRHWSANGMPSKDNQTFELWPDVSEYENTYATGYENLINGQEARLFSSWDNQTIDTHFKWMAEYGIDCAALQRFGTYLTVDPRDKAFRDGVIEKSKKAAEKYKVKFFIMYDISGWTKFKDEIKSDWKDFMKTHTSSPSYAKQNNKPVVCIWGIGVSGRPGDPNTWKETIEWFKNEGYYVIIGTPNNWRSQTANMVAYQSADMVSPWSVGSYNYTNADAYTTVMAEDRQALLKNGQDYLPVVFPGFAWSNWKDNPKNQIPRLHGDFLWRQFVNVRKSNSKSVYVAMFDEYDEATAIAKAVATKRETPSNQYFLTLDEDGIEVSPDFYLRLTGDGAKLIKKKIDITDAHPTPHMKQP